MRAGVGPRSRGSEVRIFLGAPHNIENAGPFSARNDQAFRTPRDTKGHGSAFSWGWWADPAAALLMVPWLVKEGLEGVRGEDCCDDD
jgi:hypothetical protein